MKRLLAVFALIFALSLPELSHAFGLGVQVGGPGYGYRPPCPTYGYRDYDRDHWRWRKRRAYERGFEEGYAAGNHRPRPYYRSDYYAPPPPPPYYGPRASFSLRLP